jgi:serine/threonine-protein kinase
MAEVLAPEDLQEVEPSDSGSAPLTGGTRLGRYELLLPIARGGMARVWAARQHGHRGFTKLVAIKTILSHLAQDPEFEKMFLDEARIASGVHHPNVCEIYELGEEGRTLYLAMEWVAGDSLARVLKASGKLVAIDARVAARIVADACAGLNAAHNLTDDDGRPLNVVHRDVSPHNILVSADGVVKVADFGVAKALGQLHHATTAGQLKGKIAYMAPEQVTGGHMDRRSDLFSLGCVLYEATTGVQAFKGDGDHQVMHKLLSGDVKKPSELVKGYPPELEQIVMRALATQPLQRFADAERMKLALEEWLAKSGPIVGQGQVAQVVRARLGAMLDKRKERIRVAMAAPAERPPPSEGAAPPSPSEPPVQGLTPSHQGASGIKPAGQVFPAPPGATRFGSAPPLPPPPRGMMSTVRMDEAPPLPTPRLARTPLPAASQEPGSYPSFYPGAQQASHPGAPLGPMPTPLLVSPAAPPIVTPAAPPVAGIPVSGPASGPASYPTSGPLSGPTSMPPAPTSVPPPRPLQYVIASAIGIGVAAIIGVAGYYVVRASRAPAPAASSPPASTALASVEAPAAAHAASASPPSSASAAPAAAQIVFKIYPENAVLVVDGKEMDKDVRAIARPEAGAKLEVVVRAEGFKEQSFSLDDATASPVDVWLVDATQAAASSSASTAVPTAAPTADPGAPGVPGGTSTGGSRSKKNDPIPANPY